MERSGRGSEGSKWTVKAGKDEEEEYNIIIKHNIMHKYEI